MPHELLVRQNQLVHTGYFSRPLFELWGDGRAIVRGLFGAFSPFGAKLSDIRMDAGAASASDQGVTVNIGQVGLHRFRFDRVESTFFNFTDESLLKIPEIIKASGSWIGSVVSSFEFASHQFVYSSHSNVADFPVKGILGSICAKTASSGGLDLGTGVIFHWEVGNRGWTTQLVLDRSLLIKDGLYTMFTILVPGEVSDYAALARDARSYLQDVMRELDLTFAGSSA